MWGRKENVNKVKLEWESELDVVVLVFPSEESTSSSLLMTIISLSTELSDPVPPHRAGVSIRTTSCVCVCVYINLWRVSQSLLIALSKKKKKGRKKRKEKKSQDLSQPHIRMCTNGHNNSTSHNCFSSWLPFNRGKVSGCTVTPRLFDHANINATNASEICWRLIL